MEVKGI